MVCIAIFETASLHVSHVFSTSASEEELPQHFRLHHKDVPRGDRCSRDQGPEHRRAQEGLQFKEFCRWPRHRDTRGMGIEFRH